MRTRSAALVKLEKFIKQEPIDNTTVSEAEKSITIAQRTSQRTKASSNKMPIINIPKIKVELKDDIKLSSPRKTKKYVQREDRIQDGYDRLGIEPNILGAPDNRPRKPRKISLIFCLNVSSKSVILIIGKKPLIEDFYCNICNTTLKFQWNYRAHLRRKHKIKMDNLVPKLIATPGVVPDVDDPNHYCKSCHRTFDCKSSYRRHLKRKHKIKLEPLIRIPKKPNPKIIPDVNDPNFYCKACKHGYNSKAVYRAHLRKLHKMTLSSLAPKCTPGVVPDVNDPNFYCCSCKYIYSTRSVFRSHLKNVHKVDYKCSICHCFYKSRRSHASHMRTMHTNKQ
jgi:hypothetical protein